MRYLHVLRPKSGMRPKMSISSEQLDAMLGADVDREPETARCPELAAAWARRMQSYPEIVR
jgi:hypothetical protein